MKDATRNVGHVTSERGSQNNMSDHFGSKEEFEKSFKGYHKDAPKVLKSKSKALAKAKKNAEDHGDSRKTPHATPLDVIRASKAYTRLRDGK